jgi:hypothetical protein
VPRPLCATSGLLRRSKDSRTQLEAASKTAEISPQEISQRRSEESISSKRVVVMRRRNGQKAILPAIPIGHEAKPEVWYQR